jgi:DNA-binding GntR family transcriptional regulator
MPPAAIAHLRAQLDGLQATAATADATQIDRSAVTFYELLIETLGRKLGR